MKNNTTSEPKIIREEIIKILDNIEDMNVLLYFYHFIKGKLKISD